MARLLPEQHLVHRERLWAPKASSRAGPSIGRNSHALLAGVRALAQRRLPLEDVDRVSFILDEPLAAKLASEKNEKEEEYFHWEVIHDAHGDGNRAIVTGTSVSALCKGLSRMYEVLCGTSLVSWADASRPQTGCLAAAKLVHERVQAEFSLRYAYNTVTFAYSAFLWTTQREWEDTLDWLALRGVNIALAHVGFETIYRRAAIKVLGVDPISSFFTAEALFPWNRMGNIQGVGGPPSESYLKEQLALQHFVLRRMISLGITPILHGFNGFVPKEAVNVQSQRQFASQWFGFSTPASNVQRLPPSNQSRAMAQAIALEYLAEFPEELGSLEQILFSVDVFNENAPLQGEDLSLVGRDLVEPLKLAVADRSAQTKPVKVVMQMWFLAHHESFWTSKRANEFLGGFPRGTLILLDLHGEVRPQWKRMGFDRRWSELSGHSVVWCVLHNFGGGNGLGAELEPVFTAIESAKSNGLAGVGMAPEGIGANELEFDVVLASAWGRLLIPDWLRARYREQIDAQEAWKCALETVYNRPSGLRGYGPTKSVLELRPGSRMRHKGFQPTDIAYNVRTWQDCTKSLVAALAAASPFVRMSIPLNKAFEFDVVDWTRQLISDLALLASEKLDAVRSDPAEVKKWSSLMLALIDAMQSVICMHTAFSGFGMSEQARKLVTVWHEDTHSLVSYASRQLCVLMPLYRNRWSAYLAHIGQRTTSSRPPPDYRRMELEWAANITDGAGSTEPVFALSTIEAALELCSKVLKDLL